MKNNIYQSQFDSTTHFVYQQAGAVETVSLKDNQRSLGRWIFTQKSTCSTVFTVDQRLQNICIRLKSYNWGSGEKRSPGCSGTSKAKEGRKEKTKEVQAM